MQGRSAASHCSDTGIGVTTLLRYQKGRLMEAAETTLLIVGDKAAPALGTKHNAGFSGVARYGTTSEFQAYLTNPDTKFDAARMLVVLDESTEVDNSQNLESLARGLDNKGVKVILVGVPTSNPLRHGSSLDARAGEKHILSAIASLGVVGVNPKRGNNPSKGSAKPAKPKQKATDTSKSEKSATKDRPAKKSTLSLIHI